MPASLPHHPECTFPPATGGVAALLFDPWPLYLARSQNPALAGGLLAVGMGGRVVAADPAVRKAGVSLGMRTAAAAARVEGLSLVLLEAPALQAAWEALLLDLPAFSPWVEALGQGRVLLLVSEADGRALAVTYGCRVGFACYREIALLAALSAQPGRVRLVPWGTEAAFSGRLPLYLLKGLGLGAGSLEWLTQLGQSTLGDLRQWSTEQLRRTLPEFSALKPYLFGPWSPQVARAQPPERLRVQHTFAEAALEPAAFEPVLERLATQLARQLQAQSRAASRLRLLATAGGSLHPATRLSKEPLKQARRIYRLARLALEDTQALGLPLERLGLELSALSRPALQGGMWETRQTSERAAQWIAERFPEAQVRVQTLDPYALAADQRSVWVRLLDGRP